MFAPVCMFVALCVVTDSPTAYERSLMQQAELRRMTLETELWNYGYPVLMPYPYYYSRPIPTPVPGYRPAFPYSPYRRGSWWR